MNINHFPDTLSGQILTEAWEYYIYDEFNRIYLYMGGNVLDVSVVPYSSIAYSTKHTIKQIKIEWY